MVLFRPVNATPIGRSALRRSALGRCRARQPGLRAILELHPRQLLLVHRLHDDTSGYAQTLGRFGGEQNFGLSHGTPPSSTPTFDARHVIE
jgi:hypothetical protein